jgi:tetratricopeptide (TPR) repeat protein
VSLEIQALYGEILSRRGDRAEARRLLEAALPVARRSKQKAVLARMLGILVRNAQWDDDLPAAQRYLDEALPLAREIGDEAALMFILRQAGNLILHERERAMPLFEESLALARKIGDGAGQAAVLNSMGNLLQYHDEFEQAHAMYVAAVQAAHDDPFIEELSLENMGANFVLWGRPDEGIPPLEAALRISRQHRLRIDEASTLENLAMLELRRGNPDAAEAHLNASFAAYREHTRPPASLVFLYGVLVVQRGDRDRGLALIGLALAQPAGQIGIVSRLVRAFRPQLQGTLSDSELEERMAAGRSLDFDTVLREIGGEPT